MKKAFTMIEIIIVIVILGIVAGLGIEIIKFAHNNNRKVMALNELEIKSQVAADFISTHLNNSIKNSFRLKKASSSKCLASETDCKFVYDMQPEDLVNGNFKIFEWARIDLIDRKKGYWDGITDTKQVIDNVRKNNQCFSADNFNCFVDASTNKRLYNYITKEFGSKTYGLYFLGDNIANSTSFIERDLYTINFDQKKEIANIKINLNDKNFTISNAYLLVDKIEGLYYKDKQLRFYSEDWKDVPKNNDGYNIDADAKSNILVDDVDSFKISNIHGVTRFQLCLKKDNLPGSFISSSHSIKVCKTGVII